MKNWALDSDAGAGNHDLERRNNIVRATKYLTGYGLVADNIAKAPSALCATRVSNRTSYLKCPAVITLASGRSVRNTLQYGSAIAAC